MSGERVPQQPDQSPDDIKNRSSQQRTAFESNIDATIAPEQPATSTDKELTLEAALGPQKTPRERDLDKGWVYPTYGYRIAKPVEKFKKKYGKRKEYKYLESDYNAMKDQCHSVVRFLVDKFENKVANATTQKELREAEDDLAKELIRATSIIEDYFNQFIEANNDPDKEKLEKASHFFINLVRAIKSSNQELLAAFEWSTNPLVPYREETFATLEKHSKSSDQKEKLIYYTSITLMGKAEREKYFAFIQQQAQIEILENDPQKNLDLARRQSGLKAKELIIDCVKNGVITPREAENLIKAQLGKIAQNPQELEQLTKEFEQNESIQIAEYYENSMENVTDRYKGYMPALSNPLAGKDLIARGLVKAAKGWLALFLGTNLFTNAVYSYRTYKGFDIPIAFFKNAIQPWNIAGGLAYAGIDKWENGPSPSKQTILTNREKDLAGKMSEPRYTWLTESQIPLISEWYKGADLRNPDGLTADLVAFLDQKEADPSTDPKILDSISDLKKGLAKNSANQNFTNNDLALLASSLEGVKIYGDSYETDKRKIQAIIAMTEGGAPPQASDTSAVA